MSRHVDIQQLVSVCAIEAFDVGVLVRLSWLHVVELDTVAFTSLGKDL